MVLCAVAPEHKDVKLLAPTNPDTASIGDKITYKGYNDQNEPPLTPNQVAKKKVFEGLVPYFYCNDKGQATWNNVLFSLNNSDQGVSVTLNTSLGRYAIS